MTTNMTAPQRVSCPPWCDDHDSFHDGSADWHKSHETRESGIARFVTTGGSVDGQPEVYFDDWDESLSLTEAERFAYAILELVREARR